MKVILYIGHHKVGSTALQVYLSQNWLKLMRKGILYPAIEPQGMAHNLNVALRGKDETGILPMNVREPHNALAFRFSSSVTGKPIPGFHENIPPVPQIINAIQRQVEELAPHTVILCSEVMSNFGAVEPKLINRLCNIFPDAEFQICCTLRRPDEYLASWHGQRLKFGHDVFALHEDALKRYFKSIHFDYRKLLEPWLKRRPEARFTIRNYADVLKAGGSTEDFVAQAEARFPRDMVPAPRANPSLPYALMEIARRGNHALAGDAPQALTRALMKAAKSLKLAENAEIEMFGADNRAQMAALFQPIDAWLGEVTGQAGFFPDLDKIGQSRPLPELDAANQALAQIGDRMIGGIESPPAADFLSQLRRDGLS